MSKAKHDDLPEIKADPWTRFDMWADLAKQHALDAISTAVVAGGHEENDPTATSKAHGWAADVFRDLATACVPSPTIGKGKP